MLEMKSEKEKRLKEIREEKSQWLAIIKRWDEMTALSPPPAFTKEYVQKMIKELEEKEERELMTKS